MFNKENRRAAKVAAVPTIKRAEPNSYMPDIRIIFTGQAPDAFSREGSSSSCTLATKNPLLSVLFSNTALPSFLDMVNRCGACSLQ